MAREKRTAQKTLLTIAGFDPSAGAGTLLDLRTFRKFGFHGAAVLTAVTIQDTARVRDVRPLAGAAVLAQYKILAKDIRLSGIKVGMAATAENMSVIAGILEARKTLPRVVDPVFKASAGPWLLEKKAVPEFAAALRGKATVITPNLDEAGMMLGSAVRNLAEAKAAAAAVFDLVRMPCLIKGGHLEGDPVNVLFDGLRFSMFPSGRIAKDVHGTGCLLSAALLCHLAAGRPLVRACGLATSYVRRAIQDAVRIGRGRAIAV